MIYLSWTGCDSLVSLFKVFLLFIRIRHNLKIFEKCVRPLCFNAKDYILPFHHLVSIQQGRLLHVDRCIGKLAPIVMFHRQIFQLVNRSLWFVSRYHDDQWWINLSECDPNLPDKRHNPLSKIIGLKMKFSFSICNSGRTFDIRWDISLSNGIFIFPKPPSFRGVFIQAKWVKWESILHAITSVLIFLNSSTRSENAKISVGHTKVLQCYIRILQPIQFESMNYTHKSSG